MHIGNTMTTRVEFAHNWLKKYFYNSMGDIYKNKAFINNMLKLLKYMCRLK